MGRYAAYRAKSVSVVKMGTSCLAATAQMSRSMALPETPCPRQTLKKDAA